MAVNMNEKVTTRCYNQERVWNSRSEAIAFFREGAEYSEGSEHERYTNILNALYDGETYAVDFE